MLQLERGDLQGAGEPDLNEGGLTSSGRKFIEVPTG